MLHTINSLWTAQAPRMTEENDTRQYLSRSNKDQNKRKKRDDEAQDNDSEQKTILAVEALITFLNKILDENKAGRHLLRTAQPKPSQLLAPKHDRRKHDRRHENRIQENDRRHANSDHIEIVKENRVPTLTREDRIQCMRASHAAAQYNKTEINQRPVKAQTTLLETTDLAAANKPEIDLNAADVITIRELVKMLHALLTQGTVYIELEKGGTFLESLESAIIEAQKD